MAWKGAWGTFVHIPKCGGFGLRRYLRSNMGSGYEDPPYHGLPETVERGFTLVRHPVSWLRSIWAYRDMHQWKIRRTKDNMMNHVNHWPAILTMTQWAAGLSWPEFVDGLVELDNDIVYSIYGMYRHPNVKIYQLEHVDELLADLGMTAPLPIAHVTPNKPQVTPRQREKLEHVCRYSIRAYGYDTRELTEVDYSSYISEVATSRMRLRELERM